DPPEFGKLGKEKSKDHAQNGERIWRDLSQATDHFGFNTRLKMLRLPSHLLANPTTLGVSSVEACHRLRVMVNMTMGLWGKYLPRISAISSPENGTRSSQTRSVS